MKIVTIFARGESSKYVGELSKPDFTIIANEFGNEIQTYTEIGEYIKDSEIHICCNGWPTELDAYRNINFFEIYKPKKLIRPYLADEPRVNIQNSCHLPDIFLSEIHKKWMFQRGVSLSPDFKYEYSYPSTGIATLAYAVLEVAEDGDEINIIGLDFYENSGYLYGKVTSTDWGVHGQMQQILYDLVFKHPSMSFNMITTAEKYLEPVSKLSNMNMKKVKI